MIKLVDANNAEGQVQHVGVLHLFLFLFNPELSVLASVVDKQDLIYFCVCVIVFIYQVVAAFLT